MRFTFAEFLHWKMDGEADNSTADYDNSSTDNCTTDCVIYYTRPNASLAERLAIGGTYCLLTSAFLFLQCSILIVSGFCESH
jgi:hypothetical protein